MKKSAKSMKNGAGKEMVRSEWVDLQAIELDMSTQGRVAVCPQVVSEYGAELDAAWDAAVARGDDMGLDSAERGAWPFPPVMLYFKAGRYWVGDGFHRVMAAHGSDFSGVLADVCDGGVDDALAYALGANREHGLRRSSADIQRCVELACMKFSEFTDNRIAEMVGCSNHTVAKYRPEGSRMGYGVAQDGRVFGGLPAGMDEVPVEAGSEGYVDDGGVRCVVVGVESGSVKTNGGLGADAVVDFELGYVRLDRAPGIAEVAEWVTVVPTYGELMAGSDVAVVRMRDESGAVHVMVRRDLVVAWCENLDADGKVRWDGFRARPVSLEHAEREREKWQKEQGRDVKVEWLAGLLDVRFADMGADLGTLVLLELRKLLPKESAELVAEAERKCAGKSWLDVMLALLVSTALLERGVEYVEREMLGMKAEI